MSHLRKSKQAVGEQIQSRGSHKGVSVSHGIERGTGVIVL